MASDTPQKYATSYDTITINNDINYSNRSLIAIIAPMQAPLKLTAKTYFPWRAQWDALLIAYDIYSYSDGSLICPPVIFTFPPLHLQQSKLYLLDITG